MIQVAGYISSIADSGSSIEVQRELILNYCELHNLHVKLYIEDIENSNYDKPKLLTHIWKRLYHDIDIGLIKTILVDTKIRLYKAERQTLDFFKLCHNKQVKIIEVGLFDPPDSSECKNVAIYHFTNRSQKRPSIVLETVDTIYTFSSSHKGWKVKGIFVDDTLIKTNQEQYKALLHKIDRFDILLSLDFYHIETKTTTFWNTVIPMLRKGMEIVSIKNGKFTFLEDDAWLKKELKVAIYYRKSNAVKYDDDFRVEILSLFITLKTVWTLVETYVDTMSSYYSKQPKLMELLDHIQEYDLVLVNTFNDINIRTAMFMKIKHTMHIPIYSLKEGGILL